jgi:predicted ATPase
MLRQISITNFKSLVNIHHLKLPRLAVFFGAHSAGKSNLLEAIQTLARLGTARTLAEALQDPFRGHPLEAFSFPSGGLPTVRAQTCAEFKLEALLNTGTDSYEYRITVSIDPRSGSLAVEDEYLAALTGTGNPRGNPLIESREGELRVRRRSKPAHPRQEPLGLHHTLLSDPRLGGVEYSGLERCREELLGWTAYSLDPHVSMRRAAGPAEVSGIGVSGEDITPYLYRLRTEREEEYGKLVRTLSAVAPGVEDVAVDLDPRRGTLGLTVRSNGVAYSSRILSDGTLRLLALCAIAVNPWSGSLLAIEEPENGVDPHGLEPIVELLVTLALEGGRQVLVTTHSPLFCAAVFRRQREHPEHIGVFRVSRGGQGTEIENFPDPGPLFTEREVLQAM